MTPDELRALADALEPMAAAPRFDDLNVPAFCAWLRAQADAQPVAWMHDGLVSTNKERVEHDEMRNRSCGFKPKPIIPLYAAPAAPQAEPSEFKFQPQAGALARSWDRADALAEPKEENNVWKQIIPDHEPQAEPKREPLSDEPPKVEWLSTDDAETQLALAIRDAVKVAPSADDKALLYALNRRGIWLAWIGGSDAE